MEQNSPRVAQPQLYRAACAFRRPWLSGVCTSYRVLPAFLAQHPAIDVDIVFDDRNINLVEAGINIGLRWSARQFRINRPQDCASERRVIGTPSYLIA